MEIEEILDNCLEEQRDSWMLTENIDFFDGYASTVFKAMREYAKQENINFGTFLRENNYYPVDKSDKPNWIQAGSKVGWLQPGMSIVRTTEDIVNTYLQSKQK